jgi:hypothetical protein
MTTSGVGGSFQYFIVILPVVLLATYYFWLYPSIILSSSDLLLGYKNTKNTYHYDMNDDRSNVLDVSKATGVTASNLTTSPLYDLQKLPSYMTYYFQWHREQLAKFNSGELSWEFNRTNDETNQSPRVLIVRCLENDKCGGTADRLRELAIFVFIAARTNRLLFIRWNRPYPIEEFMLPTTSPMTVWNWTVPEPLLTQLEQLDEKSTRKGGGRTYSTSAERVLEKSKDHNFWIVEGNDQHSGETLYHDIVKEEWGEMRKKTRSVNSTLPSSWTSDQSGLLNTNYDHFYHDLFHATFQPSPGVKQQLKAYLDVDGDFEDQTSIPILRSDEFVAVHYRAGYPKEPYRLTRNETILKETTLYAIQCARSRVPYHSTIYFLSDTARALELVEKEYNSPTTSSRNDNTRTNDITIRTPLSTNLTSNTRPNHLNFAETSDPSQFYDVFVDLFIMSHAHCVVYGSGGFSMFGAYISHHSHCGTQHSKLGKFYKCKGYEEGKRYM